MTDHDLQNPATCRKCGIHHPVPHDYATGIPADFACRYCDGTAVRIVTRLTTQPFNTAALAGAQIKTSAAGHPWAVCGTCGHSSPGH